MMRLIVTTDSSTAGAIQRAGLAELVIAIERRLVWGQLPSDAELEAFFAPRTTQSHGLHWLDDTPPWRLEESAVKDRGLIDLSAEYATSVAFSTTGKSDRCLMDWRGVRCRRYRGSRRGRSRSTCTTMLSVTPGTSNPVFRPLSSGRRC